MKKILVLIIFLVAAMTLTAYNSKQEEQLMYNQGFFGAVFCYQTYTVIGVIADSWVGKVYKSEDAVELITETINFLTNARKNLNDLTQLQISSSDRSVLLQMLSIIDDLNREADALKNFIQTGETKYQDNYSYYREQAWKKIKELSK